jgi:hypothetical protein
MPPAPACQCFEKYINEGTACEACPYGRLTYKNGDPDIYSFESEADKKSAIKERSTCSLEAERCPEGQVKGNPENCYQCKACFPGYVPDSTGTRCIIPIVEDCHCTEKYSMDMTQCLPCQEEGEAGQMVRDPMNKHRCMEKKCGDNSAFAAREKCFACIPCGEGFELDVDNNKCRKIVPKCGCTEILVAGLVDEDGDTEYYCKPCDRGFRNIDGECREV